MKGLIFYSHFELFHCVSEVYFVHNPKPSLKFSLLILSFLSRGQAQIHDDYTAKISAFVTSGAATKLL